jgi:FKBP-type peptidyl-prolyl cis-trans isomerase 2
MNVIMQIEKVSGDEVDVRLVHPLADKDIKYSVEIVQVSDPRPPPMPVAALDLEEDK